MAGASPFATFMRSSAPAMLQARDSWAISPEAAVPKAMVFLADAAIGTRDHPARAMSLLWRRHAYHRDIPTRAKTDVARTTKGAGSMTHRL
ncbi:hypothetical protein [Primorskyibacter flagellatus]|uniref:hypothetical protein n=1 Tax=Primorskyibacter flagellatus TaxID=1387277 RepID=UPI0015C49E03|nr:hypothetical protein [Primorskyibacter flagellatus]